MLNSAAAERTLPGAHHKQGCGENSSTLTGSPHVNDTAVVTATQSDYDRTIATLGAAFIADPLMRWMFPDARQYLRAFPLVGKHFGGGAFNHASAYRSADFKGAALWLPPGVGPDEEALGGVMQEMIAAELHEEAFALLEQVGEHHPQEPHWYLPVIGVDPVCQGKGYGSALLAHSLAICDREHVAAYLESSNPANVPLYQRFGFVITGEIQAGSSPVVTPMFRAAR